jgi:hypothetical protein
MKLTITSTERAQPSEATTRRFFRNCTDAFLPGANPSQHKG